MVGDDRTAAADGLGSHRALLRLEAEADGLFGQVAISLFSNKFVAGITSPKKDRAALKEFAGGGAKELDQGCWIGPLRGLRGDSKEKLLESFVRICRTPAFLGRRRVASKMVQRVTDLNEIRVILTSD
jgi:hypothetical protein